MGITIHTPDETDWERFAFVGARAFGFSYTPEQLALRRPSLDLSRFRLARDGREIVGMAGSYAFDVTLPGGCTVPMAGITWVSVSPTHRRQGVLTALMSACHDDTDVRGEPVAALFASQAPIYERFGYGLATMWRDIAIDTKAAELAPSFRQPAASVRFMDPDEAAVVMPPLWDRYRRTRPGELSRSAVRDELVRTVRATTEGGMSPAFYLRHADGYAVYRVTMKWNNGFPAHEVHLDELVAITPEAHAALWQTLLALDLVGSIVSERVPLDDALPFVLTDFRAVRTTNLSDGVWVNVRDAHVAFGARSYSTADRMVVELTDGELQGHRYAIEGSPAGSSCRTVRARPDLTVTHAALGSLLYGGVQPSALAAGRRLTARNAAVLRRADLFFAGECTPHCATMF